MRTLSNSSPQTLDGQRVRLTPLSEDQVDDLYLSWLKDPEVVKHLDARYSKQTTKSIRLFVREFDQQNNLIWRIKEKKSNISIGNIQTRINWLHKTADIGILIGNRDFWGHGIGQESLELVMTYLFEALNLEKITMGTRSTNLKMLKTIKKLGFEQEARLRQHVVDGNSRTDIILFGMLKSYQN